MGDNGWPLVGRDVELGAARAVLAGRGALVVAGEAGVGKSRLAREVVAREGGASIVVTASDSSREIPLGAFAPVLGPLPPDADGLSGLERALAAMRAAGPSTLLLVDDAHLLDGISATLVAQLVADRTVRLLLVVRSGEPAPDAVTAIWKDGHAERTDLAPLGEPQAARLLRAALGGELDVESRQRLVAAGHGNVLWLRHLVEGEREAGRLVATDGVWRWRGLAGLPPALRDLVAARIGDLTAPQRRILELLALSEPLGLDLLGELADPDAVEDVAHRELITVEPDGARWQARLGHPLYGESVRAAIGAPRARRLRGELSAALGRTGGRRADDGLRRAVLDLGSDRSPTPDLLVRAAAQAAVLGDFVLSERLWRAACDVGGGFEARVGLGQMLNHQMRVDEAEPELARAEQEARTEEQRLRALVVRFSLLYFMVARVDDAVAIVERAAAELGPGARPTLDALRAMVAVMNSDFVRGSELVAAVLAHAEAGDLAETYAAWAGTHVVTLGGERGPLGPLGPIVDRGMAAARRGREAAVMQANIGHSELLDADLRGEPEAARRRLEWVRGLAGMSAPTLRAIYDGQAELSAGHLRAAIRMIETALPYFPGHGGGWGVMLQGMRCVGFGMLGDAPAARRALAATEAARHPGVSVTDWQVELARAWTSAAEGSVRDAIRYALRAADRAGTERMAPVEVVLRQTAVRFGDRGQAPRLTALAAELGTARARLGAAHATALAAGDVAGLLAVSTELEAAAMGLEAADASAQAATLARTGGRWTAAAAAEHRLTALTTTRDGARTPAIREATVPLPLSEREREVATMAADGLTNREIAARLGVSVRTVESHVYRACTRLGLADRAALVAVVVPPSSSRPAEVP